MFIFLPNYTILFSENAVEDPLLGAFGAGHNARSSISDRVNNYWAAWICFVYIEKSLYIFTGN